MAKPFIAAKWAAEKLACEKHREKTERERQEVAAAVFVANEKVAGKTSTAIAEELGLRRQEVDILANTPVARGIIEQARITLEAAAPKVAKKIIEDCLEDSRSGARARLAYAKGMGLFDSDGSNAQEQPGGLDRLAEALDRAHRRARGDEAIDVTPKEAPQEC